SPSPDASGAGEDADGEPPRLVTTPLGDARMTASPLRVGPASLSLTWIPTALGGDAPAWG
ncbi:hypothetical protein, partial [Clavibacter phaseoli]|uniref:hypothetical protein n=1 Tax=Clavibacter phaseoli TaxID=1734031 RepID=UPI001C716791